MNLDDHLKRYIETFTAKGRYNPDFTLPSMKDITRLEESLLTLLFPVNSVIKTGLEDALRFEMNFFISILKECIMKILLSEGCSAEETEERCMSAITSLLEDLPEIREKLKLDAIAGYDGDPAARSISEVIICYPAFRALCVHRISHHLFRQGIPMLPRMMNELIHSQTGIDIHPGAEIGKSFFIDHGTGVVIGETTVIGDNVKLYQGVTLGALSFPKDACGQLLKGAKRHPTIGDNVTIYANATILGDITIGDNCTIGSSCWIKSSVPANTRVLNRDPEMLIVSKKR